MPDTTAIARKWVNDEVKALFWAEIANERNGGVAPSTLSSTIDSIQQMPEDILTELCVDGSPWIMLTSLLVIRDLLPGDTPIRDLVGEGGGDKVDKLTFESVNLTIYRSPDDAAFVVEIDTQEGTGEVRVYVNDGQVFAADPEVG